MGCPQFSEVGPVLQHHLRSIDRFLETSDISPATIEPLCSLGPVWNEAILIVDGNPAIKELLAEFLSRTGEVNVARDGKQALEKGGSPLLCHHYFLH